MDQLSKKNIATIVMLIGSYLVFQAIADVGATKFVQLGNFVMPAGVFVFTITFTIRDMIHKRLGKYWAQVSIVVAGILNVLMALFLFIVSKLPAPDYYQLNDAWSQIFSIVPAITLGSITSEVISELVDTEVYHTMRQRFSHFPQWLRVLVSNFISLPIDSLIFSLLAFSLLPYIFGGEILPISVAISLTLGQIVWKAIVTIISMPLIYLVKEKR